MMRFATLIPMCRAPRPQGEQRLPTAPRHAKPLVEALEKRLQLSTFTVDSLTDSGQGLGLTGDLRYALTQVVSGDSIRFAVSGTIALTGPLPALRNGLTIEGPGPDSLTVERASGGDYGIFRVAEGAAVSLSGLTLANGMADYPDLGGGIYNPVGGLLRLENCVLAGNHVTDIGFNVPRDSGGGLWNGGMLLVSDSTFSGNYAGAAGALWGNGGGLSNFGTATITHSTFSDNGGETGAALFNQGTLTLDGCTISNNTGDTGGGIANFTGTLMVTSSTLTGNTADASQGGGIFNFYGTASIRYSTLAGNSALWGGGIWNNGPLTASETTLYANHAHLFTSAGGIANYTTYHDTTLDLEGCTLSANTVDSSDRTGSQLFSSGSAAARATVVLRNTILQGDGDRPNCFADIGGAFVSLGHNLSSDDSGNLSADGDLVNTDPLLGPLGDHGGPTPTLAPLPGSPAVDAGDNSDAPAFDQRGPGFARIVGGQIDIGALEAQPGPAARLLLRAPADVLSGTPFDVTVTAKDAYGHPVAGYNGTVTFQSTDVDAGVILASAYTFTAEDDGMHTFAAGFVLLTPGTQTIIASDAGDSQISGSLAVAVAPAGATPPGRLAPPHQANGKVELNRVEASDGSGISSRYLQVDTDLAAITWFFGSRGGEQNAGAAHARRLMRDRHDGQGYDYLF